MPKHYRIVFECYESSPKAQQISSKTVMMAGSIDKPEDVFNFWFAHEDQIKLVHSCSTKAPLILHFLRGLCDNVLTSWVPGSEFNYR